MKERLINNSLFVLVFVISFIVIRFQTEQANQTYQLSHLIISQFVFFVLLGFVLGIRNIIELFNFPGNKKISIVDLTVLLVLLFISSIEVTNIEWLLYILSSTEYFLELMLIPSQISFGYYLTRIFRKAS